MRILLTAHAFPPRSTAGVEVYTLRLARALRQLRHEVLVLCAVHDLDAAHAAVRGRQQEGVAVAEIVSAHPHGTLVGTYDDPALSSAAGEVIRGFAPDCVHVQHLLNLSAELLRQARLSGAGVLMTLHDHWLSCPRDGLRMRADLTLCEAMDHAVCAVCLRDDPRLAPPLQASLAGFARRVGFGRHLHRLHDLAPRTVESGLKLLRRLTPPPEDLAAAMDRRATRLLEAASQADLVLAPTLFVRERALEFGLPAERVRLVPLGAVTGPPRPRRAGPRRRFGFIGTLAPHKGVHVLLEAFRGLEDPLVSLEVFGSASAYPSYAWALRRAARDDPRICFRGPFPDGDQDRVLAGLDALVLPSIWWETTGLVVLEALAAGLPVVASDIGGVPEVIAHQATGLLVPPRDVSALRSALSDLASGRALRDGLPALPVKTVAEGAHELQELYAILARPSLQAAPAP